MRRFIHKVDRSDTLSWKCPPEDKQTIGETFILWYAKNRDCGDEELSWSSGIRNLRRTNSCYLCILLFIHHQYCVAYEYCFVNMNVLNPCQWKYVLLRKIGSKIHTEILGLGNPTPTPRQLRSGFVTGCRTFNRMDVRIDFVWGSHSFEIEKRSSWSSTVEGWVRPMVER